MTFRGTCRLIFCPRVRQQTRYLRHFFLTPLLSDGSVEVLRTDKGAEFEGPSRAICEWLLIKREPNPPNSPQLNGCAERDMTMPKTTSIAACRQEKNLLLDLAELLSKQTDNLWAESIELWACTAPKVTAMTTNPRKGSPYDM